MSAMRSIDGMKVTTKKLLVLVTALLCLCGCAPSEPTPEPTPEPQVTVTPSPYLEHCGIWTDEYTGTVVWELRDDGTAKIPIMEYDSYRRLGGFGTWMPDSAGERLTLQAGEKLTLRVFTEDGFTKLWCETLGMTFVRPEDQPAARSAKYVDVTLTTENFWDYCTLEQVSSPVDEDGERIYKQVFVMRNTLYDQGLVYWDDADIDIAFVYWTTYQLEAKQMPYGVLFYVNQFNSYSAEGTITFVKQEYVHSYEYVDNCRTVTLVSGERKSAHFDGVRYEEYLY